MIKICFTKKDYVNKKDYTVWEKDYLLVELGPRGMFSEYLEMCKTFLCRKPNNYKILVSCGRVTVVCGFSHIKKF